MEVWGAVGRKQVVEECGVRNAVLYKGTKPTDVPAIKWCPVLSVSNLAVQYGKSSPKHNLSIQII
ncbi:hypothetical protein CHS0354_029566 [Potamilus streckersoni]|uniref:Uncharacterized protein n=1 Tax=Potamilus streckersoni TaxID=2493646 RepID=A0AAE0VSC1_9BIVA|nr:hypothetical protein CHS0354_029566 [Potamilus streckersoni]